MMRGKPKIIQQVITFGYTDRKARVYEQCNFEMKYLKYKIFKKQ